MHGLLARLRCLNDGIHSFETGKPLPEPLCFVSKSVVYELVPNLEFARKKLQIHENHAEMSRILEELDLTGITAFTVSGEEYYFSEGLWTKIESCRMKNGAEPKKIASGWIFIPYSRSSQRFVPFRKSPNIAQGWIKTVEREYTSAVDIRKEAGIESNRCEEMVKKLKTMPPGWRREHDYTLISFIFKQLTSGNSTSDFGMASDALEAVELSSSSGRTDPRCLFDEDPRTYWKSDGYRGQHWIRLTIKPNAIVDELQILVDPEDGNYKPEEVCINAGNDVEHLKEICKHQLERGYTGYFPLLTQGEEPYRFMDIKISKCIDDGYDTIVRGLRLTTKDLMPFALQFDAFEKKQLKSFPLLLEFDQETLYWRAQGILRIVGLIDSTLEHLVPLWTYSVAPPVDFDMLRPFLLLSKRRKGMVNNLLIQTQEFIPESDSELKITLDRSQASDHRRRVDPSTYYQAMFYQIYSGITNAAKSSKCHRNCLSFRWPYGHQWWKCVFVNEGMVDQGGGFRDSLSDISGELCPTDPSQPVPLPFFIRSPNQTSNDGNRFCDTFTVNPSCKSFGMFEFLGKIMGACFRGRDLLALSLSSFIWKKVIGQKFVWTDFASVDLAEVKVLEQIENATPEEFEQLAYERNWSCVCSDGQTVELRPGGLTQSVLYEERKEYVDKIRQTRMSEVNEQTDAIKKGLLQSIPLAVLTLMDWSEVEKRICGEPNVTIDALKKHVTFFDVTEPMQEQFWEALGNFTNDERCKFLRFVTGRRRLPVSLYVTSLDDEDVFPKASTCAGKLYLPKYSSVKRAEEKLRFAVCSCIDIDNDM